MLLQPKGRISLLNLLNLLLPDNDDRLIKASTMRRVLWEIITSDFNLVDDAFPSSDSKIVSFTQNDHGFTPGKIFRDSPTGYTLSIATSEEDSQIVGYVTRVIDANTFEAIVTPGELTTSGLTAGAIYYLSDTIAGTLTTTKPTTDGHFVKPVLLAGRGNKSFYLNLGGYPVGSSGPGGDLSAYQERDEKNQPGGYPGLDTVTSLISAAFLQALIDDALNASTSRTWSITKIKSFVDTQIADVINASPEILDTLQEIATALGNDPNFATSIVTLIGTKLDKAAKALFADYTAGTPDKWVDTALLKQILDAFVTSVSRSKCVVTITSGVIDLDTIIVGTKKAADYDIIVVNSSIPRSITSITGGYDYKDYDFIAGVSDLTFANPAFKMAGTISLTLVASDGDFVRMTKDASVWRQTGGESYGALTSPVPGTGTVKSVSLNGGTPVQPDPLGNVDLVVTPGASVTNEQIQDMIAQFFVAGAGMSFVYDDANNTFTIVGSNPLSQEQIEDIVGAMVQAGSNVTATYDDATGKITIAAASGPAGLTTEDVQDIVAALLQAGTNVSISYNDPAGTLTVTATGATDLSNYYTKSQVDAAIIAVTVRSIKESWNINGHGFSVKDGVCRFSSGWAKSQANSKDSSQMLGIVEFVADANNFTIVYGGRISFPAGTLTPGSVYYLSDTTPGLVTATKPTTVGNIEKPVLFAVTDQIGIVQIQDGFFIFE